MTEPVAYRFKRNGINWVYQENEPKINCDIIQPLYTSDQVHPRVKMTHAEFDEFETLFETTDYASIAIGRITSVGGYFNHLKNKIFSGDVPNRIRNENEFNVLWANYNPEKPEEMIKIVPTMKWFVRSKEVQNEDDYYYLINPDQLFPLFTTNIERAAIFSNKEEAEIWTNPLTEAVQLPVEVE